MIIMNSTQNDTNVTLGPELPPPSHFTVENHIWIYTAPIILVFGICTNILTIVVMRRPRMRGTSTSIYLSMLAAGDVTVVVVGLTPEWLHQLDLVSVWELHPWVCRVEMYLYYTSLDFAIWVLMAFSCDRFVAVCFPLKKRKYCTPRRALLACGAIFLVANLNAHVFWTRGAEYAGETLVGNCHYLDPYVYFEKSIRPFTVLTIAFIVPFFVIAVSNTVMVIRLTSAQNMRRETMMVARRKCLKHRARKGITQTTAMCLSACVAFLILVLPSVILLIGKQWWIEYTAFWYAKAVAGQLVYIHHSINFILYSVTGKRFRRELSMLCGRKLRYRFSSFSTGSSKQSRTSSTRHTFSSSYSPLVRGISQSSQSSNLIHDNGTQSDKNSHSSYSEKHTDLQLELSTIHEFSFNTSEDNNVFV